MPRRLGKRYDKAVMLDRAKRVMSDNAERVMLDRAKRWARGLKWDVLAECRAAADLVGKRPRSMLGAAAVVVLWVAGAGVLLLWLWPAAVG
jgi:phosphate-selective porin